MKEIVVADLKLNDIFLFKGGEKEWISKAIMGFTDFGVNHAALFYSENVRFFTHRDCYRNWKIMKKNAIIVKEAPVYVIRLIKLAIKMLIKSEQGY